MLSSLQDFVFCHHFRRSVHWRYEQLKIFQTLFGHSEIAHYHVDCASLQNAQIVAVGAIWLSTAIQRYSSVVQWNNRM